MCNWHLANPGIVAIEKILPRTHEIRVIADGKDGAGDSVEQRCGQLRAGCSAPADIPAPTNVSTIPVGGGGGGVGRVGDSPPHADNVTSTKTAHIRRLINRQRF